LIIGQKAQVCFTWAFWEIKFFIYGMFRDWLVVNTASTEMLFACAIADGSISPNRQAMLYTVSSEVATIYVVGWFFNIRPSGNVFPD